MRFSHLIVVGLGGTGSIVAEPLVRLLAYHKDGTRKVIFIDGDKFEEKNLERQLFPKALVGSNKAKVAADRVSSICDVRAIPNFINRESFLAELMSEEGLVKGCPLIILSVDNHATRKAVIAALDEAPIKDFVLVMPGNELDYGRCEVYLKSGGEVLGSHPFDVHDVIKNPTDRIPGGCAAEAPSTPQLVTANFGAAYTVMLTVQGLLDDRSWYLETYFNCRTFKVLGGGQPFCRQAPKENVEHPEEVEVGQVHD